MKLEGYYSSGDFAKKAHITKKTIRYYDEHNILKPSYVNENGARFYNDEDFARLQQILFLKYLGFSLDDIKEMTLKNTDSDFMSESLHMQMGLVDERIEQMELMRQALDDAAKIIDRGEHVDWSHMLELVNVNEMEQKLKKQYRDASNISARISLHKEYSKNPVSWFNWLFEKCALECGANVLEIGCGDASLWTQNIEKIPENISVTLTDISYGMIKDATRNIGEDDKRFTYEIMDAHRLYKLDDSFDVVIANHVLFYCDDLDMVCREIKRVLKPGGTFICSTYSSRHMKEISELVKGFDDRIELSAGHLYERFGKENGKQILGKYFKNVKWNQYEDELFVPAAEPVVEYVLSCHGNQNRYIVDRYKEFVSYVKQKTDNGFYITKDAGVFIAY
ncbi:MAG: methyltransferase domain-containing protein [Agathobacter sp.]|nr:methyltransferase domain-containing protein [Agathobacter sp.]